MCDIKVYTWLHSFNCRNVFQIPLLIIDDNFASLSDGLFLSYSICCEKTYFCTLMQLLDLNNFNSCLFIIEPFILKIKQICVNVAF